MQINVRHQTTDPGSSENTTQEKCQKAHENRKNKTLKPCTSSYYFQITANEDKEKILKTARGGTK